MRRQVWPLLRYSEPATDTVTKQTYLQYRQCEVKFTCDWTIISSSEVKIVKIWRTVWIISQHRATASLYLSKISYLKRKRVKSWVFISIHTQRNMLWHKSIISENTRVSLFRYEIESASVNCRSATEKVRSTLRCNRKIKEERRPLLLSIHWAKIDDAVWGDHAVSRDIELYIRVRNRYDHMINVEHAVSPFSFYFLLFRFVRFPAYIFT